MFRRKVSKWFKVASGATKNDFTLSGVDSINIIGPVNDQSLIVIGTRKGIKRFIKLHQGLITGKDR